MKPLMLVCAIARGGVIGANGELPWRYPEDLKHFRAVTTGHAVIMGRITYESIGRPLPNRRMIVISRKPGLVIEGCEVVETVEQAITLARQDDDVPRIIGGGQIYQATIDQATDLWLTAIDRQVTGDTRFPYWNRQKFECIERVQGETPELVFEHFRRIGDG